MYLAVSFPEFSCCVHIGEEGTKNHLHCLAVKVELPSGGPLKLVPIRPAGVQLTGGQMEITAHSPHAGGFHLRLSQPCVVALG
jgi:hypothetical protein